MITKPIRIEKESLDALEIIARKEEEKTGYKINETNMVNKVVKSFIENYDLSETKSAEDKDIFK